MIIAQYCFRNYVGVGVSVWFKTSTDQEYFMKRIKRKLFDYQFFGKSFIFKYKTGKTEGGECKKEQ